MGFQRKDNRSFALYHGGGELNNWKGELNERKVKRHKAGNSYQWSVPQFLLFLGGDATVALLAKNTGR